LINRSASDRPKLDTFAALRHRNYRLYWIGMVISQTGTWMQTLAQQWLVLQLTNSPLWLGIVGFCSAIPILVFSLFGGAVADRVDKRKLIIATQTAAMIQALVLAVLTHSGRIQIWHVVLAALVLGTINAFDRPARQTFVADLVSREDLANAIALNSTMFNASRIFGPSLAGILIAVPQIGIAGAFFINGLSFIAVIIGLVMIDVKPSRLGRSSQTLRANLLEGLAYARTHGTVSSLMVTATVTSIFGMSYTSLLPIFARDMGVGAGGQGLMMTCVGIGALIGALAVASVAGAGRNGVIWTAGNLIFPLMMILVAVSTSFPFTLLCLAVLGFGLITQNAMTQTLLQTTSPDSLRGRVMGLYNIAFGGMTPFGALQAGIVANAFGATVAIALGGAVCLSRALWLLVRAPAIRRLP
jgi:predicted MFS family arabinose efflux permease